MNTFILLIAILGLTACGYQIGCRRALGAVNGERRRLHSLPEYHGAYVALWCLVPVVIVVFAWLIFETTIINGILVTSLPAEQQALPKSQLGLLLNEIANIAAGTRQGADIDPYKIAAARQYSDLSLVSTGLQVVLVLITGSVGLALAKRQISVRFRSRHSVERMIMIVLVICSTIAILTTIGIVLSLLFEAMRFFSKVSALEFLFGLHWSPQTALRADQVGSTGAFGAVPIFAGTLLITMISMLVAVPIGLMSAIYMAEYATPRVRGIVKPLLEILAGVPTVVYGFFAALTVGPFIRDFGDSVGLSVASESALAAGLVMGIMIIPFVSSLSDDIINAVPQSLRDGAYAVGATKSETVKQVVIPAALPGIVGSILLAVSRAIGETMIVVMAAGLSANLTANPLEAVTTVTVQIVTLLVGDQEFDSAKTLAAFALGLVLFVVTLILNVIALTVVRKYREKYD